MINMDAGKEYSFEYVGQDGDLTERRILFTGVSVNANKGSVAIRGFDLKKGEYRTFAIDHVNIASLRYVRG
jgi:predicted DNA-binding transcriptional regulator YafY